MAPCLALTCSLDFVWSLEGALKGHCDNDNDNDLFRLGGLFGLYVDLYVSDSCLMKKHASTAPPQIQYYILHLLNGCSTINSTTVRLLGLLSDVS